MIGNYPDFPRPTRPRTGNLAGALEPVAGSASGVEGSRGTHFEGGEQPAGRGRDLLDGTVEGVGVTRGRGTEAADLPHVLQGGGTDVGVGHLVGVRGAQGLDAAAHTFDGTPLA
jgi:hypothetical protein